MHIVKRDKNYIVVSGHQRKKIAIKIGIKVPCIIRDDLKEDWQIEEQLIMDNLLRRHLTDYQRGEIGKRLEPILKMKRGRPTKKVEKLPPLTEKKKSRDKVAEKLGVSGKQYDKIKTVRDKAPKKIKTEWKQGKISTHQAYSLTTKKGQGMTGHDRKIIFSSEHDDWSTPKELYKKLNNEFDFDFDPCPLNPTFDGLEVGWKKCNFINPPYSNIVEFLKKGHEEINNGNTKVLVYLIPVRTDTKWFHTYVYPYFKQEKEPHAEIRFLKGRLKFEKGTGSKHSAPFPSMVVIFDRGRT